LDAASDPPDPLDSLLAATASPPTPALAPAYIRCGAAIAVCAPAFAAWAC
jgi:hypothetical protein